MLGEAAAAAHIFYGIPDVLDSQRARYAGKRVVVGWQRSLLTGYPGGGAERDESPTQTAVREVHGETGLRVSAERLTASTTSTRLLAARQSTLYSCGHVRI